MTETSTKNINNLFSKIYTRESMLSLAKKHPFAKNVPESELLHILWQEYSSGSCLNFAYTLYQFLKKSFPSADIQIGIIEIVHDEDKTELWHMFLVIGNDWFDIGGKMSESKKKEWSQSAENDGYDARIRISKNEEDIEDFISRFSKENRGDQNNPNEILLEHFQSVTSKNA